jgi:HEAT repeat protein
MPLIRKPGTDARIQQADPAAVLAALKRGNREERWAAARAATGIEGGVNALAAALPEEQDPRVREAMFTSLARVASFASVTALLPLLRRDDASMRTGALDALRAMPDAVRQHLPDLLRDADSDVRLLSCEIARSLPGDEATSILCALLAQEPEANVCAAAIEVLAELGNRAALPALDDCAARFAGTAFLPFAIQVARARIMAQSTGSHG